MNQTVLLSRTVAVQRGRRLEYFTIGWNAVEGLVAVATGLLAESIALFGFGIDSFIEVVSGSALLWRMSVDSDERKRERNERIALRTVGTCFLALAAYIAYESIADLSFKRAPEHSVPGIILACASLVAMPLLSRAKQAIGTALGSAATHADAKQTEFCTYLSAILLVGLVLNAAFGFWWADPLAAAIMVPIIAKESRRVTSKGMQRLFVTTAACDLYLDERQRPMHQIQAHVCVRIPLFQTVQLDAVLPKLRIAHIQFFFA